MKTSRVTLKAIQAAQARLGGCVTRTPLMRLPALDLGPRAPSEIWLKLETLQPIGSFKLRGACNAMALADEAQLSQGVYTASAGNMAQAVAWNARRLGIPCSVVVPDHAPQTKLDAIERLGARIIKVSFDRWWQVILEHSYPGIEGVFLHPVSHPDVIAGNGTIGLEILEDLPDVESVIIPYGGGGLSTGIATALKALAPSVATYACEVETAAPLAAALDKGQPVEIDYTPSFVDGIGGKGLLPEMWPQVQGLIKGSLVVSLDQVAAAIRLLIERCRTIAEGAGAASVAAALGGGAGAGKVVCVVSGGNIDSEKLISILAGKTP